MNDDTANGPGLKQRIHAATGDREAEAKALADSSPADVGPEEAEVAVRRAHGDIDAAEATRDDHLARPRDAVAAGEEEETDEADVPPAAGDPTDFDPASE